MGRRMTRALLCTALLLVAGVVLYNGQSAAMTACLKTHSHDTCFHTLNR